MVWPLRIPARFSGRRRLECDREMKDMHLQSRSWSQSPGSTSGLGCSSAQTGGAGDGGNEDDGVLHVSRKQREATSPCTKFGLRGDHCTRRHHHGAARHGPLRRRRPTAAPGGIVKGTPSWIHFGDGKSEIDMQLTPGKHKLALQLGDDLHNTLPGACQMITVTVK